MGKRLPRGSVLLSTRRLTGPGNFLTSIMQSLRKSCHHFSFFLLLSWLWRMETTCKLNCAIKPKEGHHWFIFANETMWGGAEASHYRDAQYIQGRSQDFRGGVSLPRTPTYAHAHCTNTLPIIPYFRARAGAAKIKKLRKFLRMPIPRNFAPSKSSRYTHLAQWVGNWKQDLRQGAYKRTSCYASCQRYA